MAHKSLIFNKTKLKIIKLTKGGFVIIKGKYRNKKTKGIYTVTDDIVRNATNKQDGQKMVLYRSLTNMLFVREYDEFMLKFDKV